MFAIGQKVTPKNNGQWMDGIGEGQRTVGPRKGDVLIIRGIIDMPMFVIDGLPLVVLEFDEYPKNCFDEREFERVIETDISIFTAMLERRYDKQLQDT